MGFKELRGRAKVMSALMRLKQSFLAELQVTVYHMVNTISLEKRGGNSIKFWGCFILYDWFSNYL